MSKDEMKNGFVPMSGEIAQTEWVGALRDLFSPDDKNPDSRRYVDIIDGVLSISADTGSEKWGKKFNPNESVNPVLAETGIKNARLTNFESKVPNEAPEEFKEQVKNGALAFTVTMGKFNDKRVLKWNGPYNGKGGPFFPAGGDLPASDCDNFWEYME